MARTDFAEMLDALIHERCRTVAAFCEAVDAAGYKIDRGNVSKIIRGELPIRRPPVEQIDVWAHVLGLSPREAKSFRLEALLTHTPDEIVALIRSQLAREERHREVLADMRQKMADLETQIATLERVVRKAN